MVDANGAGVLTTLPEVFNNGFALDPDARLFGHRPLISKAPLKFGPYVWQTYREVDVRRRRIGSALHRMFNTGELKAADLESVGIWSQNRPGERFSCHNSRTSDEVIGRMAASGSCAPSLWQSGRQFI